jgi:hypothetical protein
LKVIICSKLMYSVRLLASFALIKRASVLCLTVALSVPRILSVYN